MSAASISPFDSVVSASVDFFTAFVEAAFVEVVSDSIGSVVPSTRVSITTLPKVRPPLPLPLLTRAMR